MTLEEFFEKLKTEIITDYIVKLKYKYDCEEKYTYSNELLFVDNQCDYVWYNDWNEGQTDVEVLEYFAVSDARENKHGEWIKNDNGTYSCSLCQSWIPKEQHYYAQYCLHCGADMRERKGGMMNDER